MYDIYFLILCTNSDNVLIEHCTIYAHCTAVHFLKLLKGFFVYNNNKIPGLFWVYVVFGLLSICRLDISFLRFRRISTICGVTLVYHNGTDT